VGGATKETEDLRVRLSKETLLAVKAIGKQVKCDLDGDTISLLVAAYKERFSPNVFTDLVEFETLMDHVAASAHNLAATNYLLAKLLIQVQDGKYAKLAHLGDALFKASEDLKTAKPEHRSQQ
jgi:hypothetical protein